MYIQKGPYLQDPKKDSIIIMWETDVPSSSVVRVYNICLPHVPRERFPIQGEPMVFTGEPSTVHMVKATGLVAGQDYCYEILSEADETVVSSEKFFFRTAPEEEAAFSFVLTSENGGVGMPDNPFTAPITNLIKKEHPDFILSVGDIVWNGTQAADWDTYLFFPFRNLLYSTPFYPCIGNHEVGTDSAKPEESDWRYRNFHKYFAFHRYYSFDYGCAHFCVLDCPSMMSHIDSSDQDTYITRLVEDFENSEQYRFLEQDLAASQARWKFVAFHYPLYVSSIFDVRELRVLTPLFEKYGVDMVFNSHAIIYERSHPIREGRIDRAGVRYVVTGGYGEFDSWFRDKSNGLSAKLSSRPNYVRIALTPSTMELQAIDYEGKLFDTLTLEKEGS